MNLNEYYQQSMLNVEMDYQRLLTEGNAAFKEEIFTDKTLKCLEDYGIINGYEKCCHESRIRNAIIRISGFSISSNEEEGVLLSLFACRFVEPTDEIPYLPDAETKKTIEQCFRFLDECRKGSLSSKLEESTNVYELSKTIKELFNDIVQIRIYALTNARARSKQLGTQELNGKSITLEVVDIERLYNYETSGRQQEEIVVDFSNYYGSPVPCVYVANEDFDYDCMLCSLSGDLLYKIYEKYGDRLLEANVRSFLNANGKVNKGIRETLRNVPDRFMAYNNGIVITADKVVREETLQGYGISRMSGLQIVNGGQTVASLFFTKKKFPATDLTKVRVAVKALILKGDETVENPEEREEDFIAQVSRFSNSQNAVRNADLSSNRPFHIEMEKLSETVFCPDGVSRWFYERSCGKYNVMLARKGTTPGQLKELKRTRPVSKKITKTDLAKYLFSWEQKPDLVSQGAQKNFAKFMDDIEGKTMDGQAFSPNVRYFKTAVALGILFIQTNKQVRYAVTAFGANVTTYLIALISRKYSSRLNLDLIWERQDLSSAFKDQLRIWAKQVFGWLEQTSNGRMVSEWAKKPDCWKNIQEFTLSEPENAIPEIRNL